jgi:class 3 adenylate cyclase
MHVALAAHGEVLRSAIESHDGFLFSHTGEGVVAAFTSPQSGVDVAVAARRAFELPGRMGLATGEARPEVGRGGASRSLRDLRVVSSRTVPRRTLTDKAIAVRMRRDQSAV